MNVNAVSVFHISNDYPYTNVYPEILKGLHGLGCGRQLMYVPVREIVKITDPPYYSDDWNVVVSPDVGFIGRLLLGNRLRASFKNIVRCHEIDAYDVVHAHYLFTGGGVARLIKKSIGVPYVCTVRGTDINYYLKMPHLKRLAVDILMSAEVVTFLSPSQQAMTLSLLKRFDEMDSVAKKCVVIPNGIPQKWIENIGSPRQKVGQRPLRLLYVGELTRNKNWKSVVRAVRILNNKNVETLLTIAGDGEDRVEVINETKRDDNIKYTGYVSSLSDRICLYRQCDIFVMPSFSESFGISYLEAMTQGLPVVYSRNQGIDGFFGDYVIGAGVNPNRPNEIAEAIGLISQKIDTISNRCLSEVGTFSWDNIVKRYHEAYERSVGAAT